jgi:beta propeller repeat protein
MKKTSVAIARVATIGLLAGTTLWFGPPTPAAAAWLGPEQQLTSTTWFKSNPDVSGAKLVYSDYRKQHDVGDPNDPDTLYDIRVRDLKTGKEKVLTPKHDAYEDAVISGNRVVWLSSNGKKWSLWYHNLSTGTHKKLPFLSGEYRIDGKRLCYTGTNQRIYVYNFSTKSRKAVSPKGQNAAACDISGSTVVWQVSTGAPNFAIYAYDLGTKKLTQVSTVVADAELPRVDGSIVVWADNRDGLLNDDVFAYDLATHTERRITSDPHSQSYPTVSAGRVVYQDDRTGNGQLYLYDLATGVETRVTNNSGSTWNAAISGNRIVYEDTRTNAIQLYLSTITPPVVTISGTTSVPKGMTPALTGTIKDANGNAIAGCTLRLEYSTNGKTWTSGGTSDSTMGGMFAIVGPAISKATWFRARFDGSVDYAPAVSAKVKVKVF